MKSLRFMLFVVLVSLPTVGFAQSDGQKSFDKLKILAGSWQGAVTTLPQQAEAQGKRAGFAACDFHGERAHA